MKKTACILLTLALLFGILNVAVADYGKGDTFTVSLELAENSTATSIQFSVCSNDENAVKFVSSSVSNGWSASNQNFGNYSQGSSTPLATGAIGTVTFEITNAAEEGKAYSIIIKDLEAGDYDGNIVDGVRISLSPNSVTVKKGEEPCIHEKTTEKVTKEATCTEKGEKQQICDNCGAVVKTEEIAALGHDFGEWKVTKEATTAEEGEQERVCSRCGEVEKEAIPILVPPQHEHDAGEWKVIKEATCTEAGSKELRCTVCSEVLKTEEIPAAGHDDGEWKVTKAATCTETGTRELHCTKCGELLKAEEIPATGHDEGKWITVKEATYTEPGLEELRCTKDGFVLETREIPVKTERYVHNNIRTAGEKLADLKPELTKKWYTITAVDLGKDGVQTIDLVSGGYIPIGKLTITVNGDSVKVDYRYNQEVWDWKDYRFYTFFADAESITGAEVDEIENHFEYGVEYSIAKDLNGDTDVLLYMLNKATHAK